MVTGLVSFKDSTIQHKGRLQKKKSVKRVTLGKKGGGLRKKSNFECVNKNDILIGGEGVKTNVTFSRCFKN